MYFGHTSSLFCSRSASHTRLCRLKGSARPRNGRIFNYWLLVCSVPVAGRNMIAYPGKRLKKNNSVTEQAGYHNTIKNLKQQADNLKTKTNKQKIPFNLWGRLTAMKRFFSFTTASFTSTAQQVWNTLSQGIQTCLSQLCQSSSLKGGAVSIIAAPLLPAKVYYSAP